MSGRTLARAGGGRFLDPGRFPEHGKGGERNPGGKGRWVAGEGSVGGAASEGCGGRRACPGGAGGEGSHSPFTVPAVASLRAGLGAGRPAAAAAGVAAE